jgi:pimeloyl-ACP methyl ester carboxylesterase
VGARSARLQHEAKSRGVWLAYKLDALASDVTGLIDAAGHQRAILVGHDWGGVVAWHVAARFPERVARLVIPERAAPRCL